MTFNIPIRGGVGIQDSVRGGGIGCHTIFLILLYIANISYKVFNGITISLSGEIHVCEYFHIHGRTDYY